MAIVSDMDIYKEQLRPYIVDAVECVKFTRENKHSMLVESSHALNMTGCRAEGNEDYANWLSARSGLR